MPEKSLAEFAATFDRVSLQPRLREAEEQRQRFVDHFPIQMLRQLSLEQYVGESGLLYALESETDLLGEMSGKRRRCSGLEALEGSGLKLSGVSSWPDAGKHWPDLRDALARAMELAAKGDWESAGNTNNTRNSLPAIKRNKLFHLYFPTKFLPIYHTSQIVSLLEALGLGQREGTWSPLRNRDLLVNASSIPELSGWSPWEIAQLLEAWLEPSSPSVGHAETKRDLVIRAMRELRKRDPVANEWVKPAQVESVIVNQFRQTIGACGTVMADMTAPQFSPANRSSGVSLRLRILERDGQGRYRLPSFSETLTSTPPTPPQMPTQALNQILYGPPGTGKTYRVIREAAAIIAGQTISDDLTAKTAYDQACAEGRVRLATFHQSFSYEDFIEGIRPVMEEDGKAAFQVRDGIFKEIATEALFACLEPVPLTGANNGFESRWRALLMEIADVGELEIPGLKDATWCLSTTEKGNLRAVNKATQKELTCGHSAIAAVWQKLQPSLRATSMLVSQALGKGAHFGVIAAVYNYMQNIKPLTEVEIQPSLTLPFHSLADTNKVTIIESYLELGPASGWQLRSDKNFPPYVLIIDEINRGNISRIFGELITLIEDDKREGEANALRVTLPSSREPFTVPPNLYLLGTMNTADKSLALLDVALRRRFEFRELAPDFTACAELPEEMRAVLKRLNERIELRKDRDHRIGHAFFMGVKDAAGFNRAFVRKVVPLLQEYFFNDIDGARFVLGEIGRESEPGFLRQITAASADTKYQRNRWRWFTDVEPGMDCWSRLMETLGS